MTPHYQDDSVTLFHGDCLDVLRELPDCSVDSVVTDPPYGLGFMGREWDDLPPGIEFAAECLRVMKPGGHMLAFGGSRTWHRLATAIEDAGFEIRDSIAWLYGSGFPKSLDVSKAVDKHMVAEHVVLEWQGWGTALKPAFEPVVVARKPLAGTVAANVLAHGTGALNIDGCRVEGEGYAYPNGPKGNTETSTIYGGGDGLPRREMPVESHPAGRWPANVVLDESQAAALDAQSGPTGSNSRDKGKDTSQGTFTGPERSAVAHDTRLDGGGASRFFPTFRYEPKAPTTERPRDGGTAHPTVKPLDLMRWLVRLVTPPGGTVLEPFAGSGTTAEACIVEGFKCVAIEREADYLPLIVQRLSKPIQVALDFDSL